MPSFDPMSDSTSFAGSTERQPTLVPARPPLIPERRVASPPIAVSRLPRRRHSERVDDYRRRRPGRRLPNEMIVPSEPLSPRPLWMREHGTEAARWGTRLSRAVPLVQGRFGVRLDPAKEVLRSSMVEGRHRPSRACFLDPGDVSSCPTRRTRCTRLGRCRRRRDRYKLPLTEDPGLPARPRGRARRRREPGEGALAELPNNPTGAVADIEILRARRPLSKKYDIAIATTVHTAWRYDEYVPVSFMQGRARWMWRRFHSLFEELQHDRLGASAWRSATRRSSTP